MHSFTYFVEDLYTYTGEWFCYTSKVLAYYENLYIYGHSLVVSIMKYIIIVYWRKFDREKVIETFFWINLLHPVITISLNLIVRQAFFWDYDGMSQSDRCLGDPKNNLEPGSNKSLNKLHNLCDFVEPPNDHYLEYTVYVCKTLVCGFTVVMFYLALWNLLEILFYSLIFRFLHR